MGGILGDIWGGLWGCFAGIFEEFWRDLGGKNVLDKLKKKHITVFNRKQFHCAYQCWGLCAGVVRSPG